MEESGKHICVDILDVLRNMEQMKTGAILADKDGKLTYINAIAAELMDQSVQYHVGMNSKDIYDLLKLSRDETNLNIQTFVLQDCRERGTYFLTLVNSNSCNPIGNKLLSISENNLKVIFNSMYDAVIIHDLDGNVIDVNKKMLTMYKVDSESSVKDITIAKLSAADNPFEELPEIWARVLEGEDQFFEWKAKRLSEDYTFDVEVYLAKIHLYNQDAILANVRDISEKKKSEEMIRYLSFHDKLTSLYNRTFFEEEIRRMNFSRQLPVSIIIADVNGLKLANDAFGHLAGDELLKSVGEALRRATRSEDIIARWGGDEFAVILPNTDAETTSEICGRIHKECVNMGERPISVSIALGYATKSEKTKDISDVIKDAETLMYANKLKEGRANRQKIINSLLKRREDWDHNIEFMTELALGLAKAYGLRENELDDLKLLVYMHDISKVTIPREILAKPGALSEEEWVIVRKHSETGYRIAAAYPEYAQVADGILAHHERWDGNGYPRNLKGVDIPITARILAIIDAYDVMIWGRPYKKAMGEKEALEEIRKNSGSQFDPILAELFIKMVTRNR